MEPIKSGWQELKTTSGPKCPKLFYNFTANEDGYTTQFTDLIGFWTAISPSTDVVDYAKITKTSIDPSDSKSQLQILLQKLCQSLAGEGNTLRLEDGENEALLLQTVLALPRPLQPLKWEFYLEPRGTEDLAENVLRPCLLEASESKKKIDSLHEVIKTKDHVISKLIDKIEGSTIDLSTVFPGITGARSRKGQTTIKDAQKHVPGLKPFSRTEWQKHFHIDSPYAGFETVGLSKLVAGCEKCPKHKSHQHEQWLKKLPKATSSASQAAKLEAENASSIQDDTESDSDQFEIQRKKVKVPEKVNTRLPSPEKPSRRAKTSSPIRSSSPLLPPPPLSISQTHDPTRSSSQTIISDPSDLDTTITSTTKPRLGRLGLGTKPKTPLKSKPNAFETRTSSSPPPMPRLPSPSPAITSSPPPLPPLPTTNSARPTDPQSRPKSSSSIATLSSLNPPATPPKRKLGRLNSFRTTSNSNSASVSASATPEHKRIKLDNDTQKEKESDGDKESEKPISSTQGTPTRRLGRIGRTASQLSRQQTRSSPVPMPMAIDEQDENENDKQKDDAANDSDASTASTASSISPLPNKSVSIDAATAAKDGSTADSVPQPPPVEPDPEPEPELTKEEKTAKRREELKRKIGTNTGPSTGTRSGGAATVGNTGLRKKRKF